MKEVGADSYRGNNAPEFLPTGPFSVPADQVDRTNLSVTFELKGQVMQDGHTSDLLFDVPRVVAEVSRTWHCCEVISHITGSPEENGAHDGRLLRDGDVMHGQSPVPEHKSFTVFDRKDQSYGK